MTERTALVLGCNGQDGTFLSRRLLTDDTCYVIGLGMDPGPRVSYDPLRFRYVAIDLAADPRALRDLLAATRPQRIYHVAAVHSSAGSGAYETVFDAMLSVNVRSVHTVLEHLRTVDPTARFVYASSAKVFGTPPPPVVYELTPRTSSCLYAASKNAAGEVIQYYRRTHGLLASQLFLFNHESELRPPDFFIPKLVRCLLTTAHRHSSPHPFHTLDFYCDWGSADEYMGIMIQLLERAPGEDFVLATGRTVHARTLVQSLFAERGLSMCDYVTESTTDSGPRYDVDISKLRGFDVCPRVTIEELVNSLISTANVAA